MYKLAAISPRTQSLTVNQGPSSPEEQQFEQLFSEKAHAILGAKSPELSNSIATFKVVDSDLDSDTASGIFVCIVGDLELHVPVVLSAGSVQSPEVFYSQRSGKFLPLTSRYLKFAQKSSETDMGSPVSKKEVEGLGTPSLAGITSPPQSMGKFSSFDLPEIAAAVDDSSRVKVAEYLSNNLSVLKKLVANHGKDIVTSLSKRASAKEASRSPETEYVILDSDSPLADFRKEYGSRSKLAYMEALNSGYTAIDFRKNASELIQDNVSSSISVVEPGATGLYKLLKNDGKHVKSLVIVSPKNIGRSTRTKYLCILENGDYILCDKITAIQTSEGLGEGTALETRLSNLGNQYRAGKATFIKVNDGLVVNGTMPEKLVGFTTSNGSPLTCRIADTDLSISFLDSSGSFSSPTRSSGSDMAYMPKSYKPLYLKAEVSVEGFITQADALRRVISEGMSKASKGTVTVKKSSEGYVIDGKFAPNEKEAVHKLASLGVSVVSAKKELSSMRNSLTSQKFYMVPRSNLTKLGSIFGPSPSQAPSGQIPAQQAPLPPGMMGPPPGMMGPGGVPPEQAQMMEMAAETGNPEVLDTALAAVLINDSGMEDLLTDYAPKLLSGLDSLCRIFLTMQINFVTISEQVGPEEYTKFTKKLSKTIKSMGDLVLDLIEGKSISGGVSNANIYEY